MTANPFAALLDGVPTHDRKHDHGGWMYRADVLAALAAAVPADLAEAGEIAEQLLREADGFSVRASDTITALLARIVAQEAQIKGLEAERDNLSDKLELERALTDGAHRRAEAAEIALAAMTKERDEALASNRGLVRLNEATEARAERFRSALEEIAEYDTGATAGLAYTARAAITEAGGNG